MGGFEFFEDDVVVVGCVYDGKVVFFCVVDGDEFGGLGVEVVGGVVEIG